MRACFALSLAVAVEFTLTTGHARAQTGNGYYPAIRRANAPYAQPSTGYERTTGRNNAALSYYGGSKSLAYAPQARPAQMPAPLAVQTAPNAKPFSALHEGSNISPYLALDGRESETSLPNYFLYVKPQMDQQRAFQVQQAQYQQLQRQVRVATAGGAVTSPSGGIPTTGHSAHFMNNGGYYPAAPVRR